MQACIKNTSVSLSSIIILISLIHYVHQVVVEAKKSKSASSVKCQLDECQLSEARFALYSTVKQALESDFDLTGKEVLPFLKSFEVLRRRFSGQDVSQNGTKSIKELLNNESLKEAIKVFESDDGRALINIYRSSINGKSQNVACSEWRLKDLEFATNKLESNQNLGKFFSKIHRNFARKSAKKCLKHSCTSIDAQMSRLDSAKQQLSVYADLNDQSENSNKVEEASSSQDSKPQDIVKFEREFDAEELELCRFLRKTNESNCDLSGRLMEQISFAKVSNLKEEDALNGSSSSTLNDYLDAYYANRIKLASNMNSTSDAADSKRSDGRDEAGNAILDKCKPIRPLLDYSLAPLKWYRKQDLIEGQKLATRTFWCPSLSYWLEMDRICAELKVALVGSHSLALKSDTFAYELIANAGKPKHKSIHKKDNP